MTGRVTWTWPVLMLVLRLGQFAFWQALIALTLSLRGVVNPWQASVAWWPLSAILSNLVCIALLAWRYRREGRRWIDTFRFERRTIGRDILTFLGVMLLGGVLAYVPSVGLATLLFGNPQEALDIFLQPLPSWAAAFSLLLFPLTIALAELPTYYGYVLPRLAALSRRVWVAVLLTALFHALQHATLPLVFDGRFLLWRAAMFLPFASLVALVLARWPRLLPYLVIGHGLIDLQVVWMRYAMSVS